MDSGNFFRSLSPLLLPRSAPALCLSALHLFIRGVPGDGSRILIFSSSSAAKDRLFRHAALDNYAKSGIIKTKSEPRTRLLLKSPLYDVAYSHTQPSLGRVAVVLFALRFPDDDTHRILSNVKSKSHCTSPPFGRMEQPPARLLFTLGPRGGFFIVKEMSIDVKYYLGFYIVCVVGLYCLRNDLTPPPGPGAFRRCRE